MVHWSWAIPTQELFVRAQQHLAVLVCSKYTTLANLFLSHVVDGCRNLMEPIGDLYWKFKARFQLFPGFFCMSYAVPQNILLDCVFEL